MQPLYTEDEFKAAKSRQLLPVLCLHCQRKFFKSKRSIMNALNPNQQNNCGDFCCQKCQQTHQNPPVIVHCTHCGKPFKKLANQIAKTKHHFCCQSCAAIYTNAHKTKGTRVSKLEKWLAIQLPNLYPALEFHCNRKDAINGELDIFIPALKLAFELNGIFHYEPIYGPEKLAAMQTNDTRKAQACLERGIELCTIDVSSMSYFKEQRAVKFLTIIQNLIDSKLAR